MLLLAFCVTPKVANYSMALFIAVLIWHLRICAFYKAKNYAGGISVRIYMSLVCICVSLRVKKSAVSDTLRHYSLGDGEKWPCPSKMQTIDGKAE